MAKTKINDLKTRRFWMWLMCEVYQNPAAIQYYKTHPVKQDGRCPKLNIRKLRRACDKAWKIVEKKIKEVRSEH